MAHDEQNEAKSGDHVTIAETRPISARKHFTLVKVVERATIRHEEAVVTEKSKATKKKVAEANADVILSEVEGSSSKKDKISRQALDDAPEKVEDK
jgi:hypothetical protein